MNKSILKIALAIIVLASLLISCDDSTKSNNNILTIKIDGIQENATQDIFLYDYKMTLLDSVRLDTTGKYEITKTWEEPQVITMRSSNNREIYTFLSEKGNIDINLHMKDNSIDFNSTEITYASQNENIKHFQNYKNRIKEFSEREKKLDKEWQALRKEYDNKMIPAEARASIDSAFNSFFDERKNFFVNYVDKNNNLISQYIYLTQLRFYYDTETLDTIFQETPQQYKTTTYYKELQKKYDILKNIKIGAIAPEIVHKDTAGNDLALSSLRGKYVLLDFWASWCKPCRQENPWVKKAYDKFHNKGFDVYAVSLDYPGDKNDWIEAIKTDELTWHHVSALKGWRDSIVKLYNISGIPSPFLLDPEGKIIAKGYDLREEKLIKTLDKYLSK